MKQSLHIRARGFTAAPDDGFLTHVHNLRRETPGWINGEGRRQVPGRGLPATYHVGHGPPPPGPEAIAALNEPAAANAALSAFLRGVERRGAVFAQWQGGDAEAGDAALAEALRGFREAARKVPFAEWPRQFWTMLLAAPGLRHAAARPAGDAPPHLGALGSGPRAALLLRLVAGLAESEAAAVLGIARPTYRLALQRALPRDSQGNADPDAWRALSEQAQQAIRAVPDARLQRIVALRDGRRPPRPARPAAPPAHGDPRPRWLWPATIAVLLATAAALAATWWPWASLPAGADAARIRVEELPPAPAPAARFDPDSLLGSHRDLALLMDAASGEFDEAADPAFEAWLAARLAQPDGPLALPADTATEGADAVR